MQKNDYLLALSTSLVLALIVWITVTLPRDPGHQWQGPLKSASFAPFRNGQSPLEEIFPTPSQVESDLLLLKGIFSGIRTYTAQGGLEVVPALAARHGFQLTHSAWLGRDQTSNQQEVDALIAAANQYPQAVQRVIVGNEVLLRRDLDPAQLIAHIDRVQAAVQQPVSYADVWAFWLQHPQVADHVDFITIHILPYWEDEPVSAEAALDHMLETINIIKARFPGKPVLVGETGWPTQGRSRGPASASLLNAASYLRQLPAFAARHDFDYNVVEAFDQTWKARLEGTVGARWGVFDAERQLKFTFSGKVEPIRDALPRLLASLLLGVLFAALLISSLASRQQAILIASLCQLFAASLVYSVYNALQLSIAPASFTWLQQHWLFYGAAQGWYSENTIKYLYELLLLDWVGLQARLWGWGLALFAILFAASLLLWMRALGKRQAVGRSARFARSAYGLYGMGAIVYAYMFARAGRYMDIPLPHYWLPLTAALLLMLLQKMRHGNSSDYALFTRCGFFNRFARILLPLAALFCLYGETLAMMSGQDFVNAHPTLDTQIPVLAASLLANHELLAWCVVCILLALPVRTANRTSAV